MKDKNISLLLFLLQMYLIITLPCIPFNAWATNGTKVIANGAVSPMLGGTGVCEGQDTGVMFINPAGITKIGSRIDGAMELAFIDARLDTTQAQGNLGNPQGVQTSQADHVWLPHFGIADRIGESNIYYGFASALVNGLEVDYKRSKINPLLTHNDFDRHVQVYTIEMVPTIAYKPHNSVSLGVSAVGVLNRFAADIRNASYVENNGKDNGDHAWGIGFNVGAIYDVNDALSLGCAFKSMRWNQKFEEYTDTVQKINLPPEYIIGAAYKPTPAWLIESNVKFIHWRWVDRIRKAPDQGGYGWENQWVFSVGAQYELTERLSMRAGYNYGASPIKSDVVYANALSPLISEHHIGIGAGYKINEHWRIDGGYLHIINNRLSDNGQGDALSRSGANTDISLGVNSIYLGCSYTF